jgi:hypothetical protein
MFLRAHLERPAGTSDLVPYWVFQIPNGAKIERILPFLPLSQERQKMEILRHSVPLRDRRQGGSRFWIRPDTELVPDSSPQFRNSRLYLESLLRQSPNPGNDLALSRSSRGARAES